jgi:carboxymethylenebutenolidase
MPEKVSVQSEGRTLDCLLTVPEGDEAVGRHPAVIVIHEIFGLDAHILDVSRRVSGLGYVTVAPDLFPPALHRVLSPSNIAKVMPALAQLPTEVRRDPTRLAAFAESQSPGLRPTFATLAQVSAPAALDGFTQDLLAVGRYLRSRPDVDPSRVASVGFCFGGTLSGRLATADPDLKAAVIFYGHNPPLDAVPRIRARLLGFYGSEDPGVTQTVPQLVGAMAAAGKRFEYQIYPSAKHAFFNDTRPSYHRMSANDAWDRMVRFFGETLNR